MNLENCGRQCGFLKLDQAKQKRKNRGHQQELMSWAAERRELGKDLHGVIDHLERLGAGRQLGDRTLLECSAQVRELAQNGGGTQLVAVSWRCDGSRAQTSRTA